MDIARQKRGASGRRRALWVGGAVAALLLLWLGSRRLEPAARSVDAAGLLIGTVERGEMLREVRGPGTLVPEEWRWIAALTEARVERILVEPGERVAPDTVLLELSNPSVERAARDAEFQVSAERADFEDLRLRLESQVLAQEASFAAVEADHEGAVLDAEANARLSAERADPGDRPASLRDPRRPAGAPAGDRAAAAGAAARIGPGAARRAAGAAAPSRGAVAAAPRRA